MPQAEIKKQVDKLNEAYFDSGKSELLVYSSKSSRGRKELWNKIATRIEAYKQEGSP